MGNEPDRAFFFDFRKKVFNKGLKPGMYRHLGKPGVNCLFKSLDKEIPIGFICK